MSTSPLDSNIEIRWKTYINYAVCLLPAVLLWEIISVKSFPVLETIWKESGIRFIGPREHIWNFSMFFVHYLHLILAAIIVVFVLLELCSNAWARYRRNVVAGVVWFLNLIVVCCLSALVIHTSILLPSLMSKTSRFEALAKRNLPEQHSTAEPNAPAEPPSRP